MNSSCWSHDATVAAELEHDLLPLCAHYLLHAKYGAEPADPVARFHLANGARLRQVNWLSDVSPAGMNRSVGLTANYVYCPTDLERNRRTYGTERKINATRYMERLSRQAADLCGPLTHRETRAPAACLAPAAVSAHPPSVDQHTPSVDRNTAAIPEPQARLQARSSA